MLIPIILISLFVVIYFTFGWWISVKGNKFAWVDVFWISSFIPVTIYLLSHATTLPQAVLHLMFLVWSTRLTILLYSRVSSKAEDPRYTRLTTHWGHSAKAKYLGLFLAEGALVVFLCLPLYIVLATPAHLWAPLQTGAVILFVIAFFGEWLADEQRTRFAAGLAPGEKRVCDVGLWRYTRHPNYFFEIVIWFSFALFALPAPMGVLAFLPAAVMALLIWKVTGVPPSEEQSLRSRGPAYLAYQRTTSELIPWFRKEI